MHMHNTYREDLEVQQHYVARFQRCHWISATIKRIQCAFVHFVTQVIYFLTTFFINLVNFPQIYIDTFYY